MTPTTAPGPAPNPQSATDSTLQTPLPADAKVIFVLGGPGAGKGTQCEKIIAEYAPHLDEASCPLCMYNGIKHLSAGDLLREAVQNGNKELEATMKEGKLVPMEVTIGLLKDAMIKSGAKTFLIDGFPRAWDQAEAFEGTIKPCEAVLYFECSETVMRERLLERGKTSGRADDNESTILKRFRTFVEQSKPVIDKFAVMGKVNQIDAMRHPDEVFADVKVALDNRLHGVPMPLEIAVQQKPENGANPATGPTTGPAIPAADSQEQKLPDDSKIIFVLGGPGAGKGTQCEKILEEYKDLGVLHLSAGDLLREAVKNGNTELEAIMKEGKLVPMEVTIKLLKEAMIKSGSSTFLIDGFPRAWDQVMRDRLLQRGKTSGRADDNEETIVKRFRTFVEQSKPVVDKFAAMGKVHDISAMRAPDEVFADVKAALDFRLRGVPLPAPVAQTSDTAADSLPADSRIIFVLGGPGSGKGTQCDLIKAKYQGVHHLSAGDLLREAVKNGNKELESIMKEGKLVPMEVTIGLLKASMIASGAKRFLIDGFPRAVDQASAFVQQVMDAVAVLFFDCSEETMRERLLERGKTSGRSDDNEDTIVKRFNTFVEQSKPVIEEYKAKGKVHQISAMQAPHEVFAEVCVALDPVLA